MNDTYLIPSNNLEGFLNLARSYESKNRKLVLDLYFKYVGDEAFNLWLKSNAQQFFDKTNNVDLIHHLLTDTRTMGSIQIDNSVDVVDKPSTYLRYLIVYGKIPKALLSTNVVETFMNQRRYDIVWYIQRFYNIRRKLPSIMLLMAMLCTNDDRVYSSMLSHLQVNPNRCHLHFIVMNEFMNDRILSRGRDGTGITDIYPILFDTYINNMNVKHSDVMYRYLMSELISRTEGSGLDIIAYLKTLDYNPETFYPLINSFRSDPITMNDPLVIYLTNKFYGIESNIRYDSRYVHNHCSDIDILPIKDNIPTKLDLNFPCTTLILNDIEVGLSESLKVLNIKIPTTSSILLEHTYNIKYYNMNLFKSLINLNNDSRIEIDNNPKDILINEFLDDLGSSTDMSVDDCNRLSELMLSMDNPDILNSFFILPDARECILTLYNKLYEALDKYNLRLSQ